MKLDKAKMVTSIQSTAEIFLRYRRFFVKGDFVIDGVKCSYCANCATSRFFVYCLLNKHNLNRCFLLLYLFVSALI